MNEQPNIPFFQDHAYLRDDQYKQPHNLNARAQLHQRYSSNKKGWYEWLFSFLPLDGANDRSDRRARILDCGCGPGGLWRKMLPILPGGWRIVLADLSEGMVREARSALAANKSICGFQTADIAALPFADLSFDVVIANHMLYHVHQRQRALREVRRVLKAGGLLFATTNGADHLRELRALEQAIVPGQSASSFQISGDFSLENGAAQLRTVFENVESHHYPNSLQVTDVDDILAYLLSMSEIRAAAVPGKIEELRQTLEQTIAASGSFAITSHSGVFLARN